MKKQRTSPLLTLIKAGLRLNRIIWLEKKGLIIALMIIFSFTSFIPFLRSGSIAALINELSLGGHSLSKRLLLILVALLFSSLAPPFFSALQAYCERNFWFYLGKKFELLILQKRGEIDVASHEDPRQNDLFVRVHEGGIGYMQSFIGEQFYMFSSLLSVVIASAVLVFFDWRIFLILLLTSLPELLVEIKYSREVWGIWSANTEVKRRFFDLHKHFDKLPSLIELKITNNLKHFLGLMEDLFVRFQDEEKNNELRKLNGQLIARFCSQLALGATVVYFTLQVVHGSLLVGSLIFILASIQELRQSLSQFCVQLARQYENNLFINDMFELLDIKPTIIKPKPGFILAEGSTPEIVFDNVSFAYPGTDKTVLENFSLRIAPGEKIAIVGVNGAGKTTMVKLLARFYDPTEGVIYIDGKNLKDVNLEDWYKHLGLLFQEYSHYNFLAKDAIAVGGSEGVVDMARVKQAAQMSESDTLIEAWPKGYEQQLGKEFLEGLEPSVGQWQKLALARTFYRDASVLILDEPTSSIDAEAEAKIFEKLEALPDDRTVFLISHRFSTVRKADQIVIIEDGRISELGSHEELLEKNGTYARLFYLQAKGYK